MSINNEGYTLHINLSKEEFEAFKALMNHAPNSPIYQHIVKFNNTLTRGVYNGGNSKVWSEIKLAEQEHNIRYGKDYHGNTK